MKYIKLIILVLPIVLLTSVHLLCQGQKEVIIIEKTIDADGNEVSKTITRQNGKYTDEEIDKMIEEQNGQSPFTLRSRIFDLNNLNDSGIFGFGPSKGSKVKLGIRTKDEKESVTIVGVSPGSGAARAGLREGDVIISINDIAISTTADISAIIEEKNHGDKVTVQVYRDGQTFMKEVELGVMGSDFFFESDLDFGEFGGMRELMDQLQGGMSMFIDTSGKSRFFDFDDFMLPEMGQYRKNENISDKPSLGAFVEDQAEGLTIIELIPNGAAQYAGLLPGDVIIEADDQKIKGYDDLSQVLKTKKLDDILKLQIKRKSKTKLLDIKLK